MRRWLFILALALLALPARGASRIYLANQPEELSVVITPDAGWEESDQFLRYRALVQANQSQATLSGASVTGATTDITEDQANWQEIYRQFITPPLDVGTVFTSGVTTVSMQARVQEIQTTDDVTQGILGIRIVGQDGTVRATLLAVANYGPTAEFNTNFRNKTFADGDTITASYTTVSGDRLVIEVGWQTDGAETTPQARGSFVTSGTHTDCPVDETTATICSSWIEFSNDFGVVEDTYAWGHVATQNASTTDASSFNTASVSPVAGRLYLLSVINTHGTAATTPTVTGASMTWNQVTTTTDASGVYRVTVFRSESASPGSGALTIAFGGTTQTACSWTLTEWTNTQAGADADVIVQSKAETAASGTSLTITFDNALSSARNPVYIVVAHAANEIPVIEANHEHLYHRAGGSTPNLGVGGSWTYNDSTPSQSWATSSINVGVALEIREQHRSMIVH